MGYPECDFIKQIAFVLYLWAKKGSFPVLFEPLSGFNDETNTHLELLDTKTSSIICEFLSFQTLEKTESLNQNLVKIVKDLGQSGILLCLGFRKTAGSTFINYPSRE